MAKKKKNMLIQNSNLTGCLVSLSAKYCSPIQQQCEISTGIHHWVSHTPQARKLPSG